MVAAASYERACLVCSLQWRRSPPDAGTRSLSLCHCALTSTAGLAADPRDPRTLHVPDSASVLDEAYLDVATPLVDRGSATAIARASVIADLAAT